jgi:hypothetical protein
MTRVPGPSLDQLDQLADDYAALVEHGLAAAAMSNWPLGNPGGVEDLAGLRTFWAGQVDGVLLPALGVAFEVGAATIRVGLREATGLTAEEEVEDGGTDSAKPGSD